VGKIFNDFGVFALRGVCADGKHVTLQTSVSAESSHFNQKKTHSLVLLVVVNALYNFVIVDMGAYGRQSDGNVFA